MTFYEQELCKIVSPICPDATYVGRACYVKLGDLNRAKLEFISGIVSNQYNALRISIINRNEGKVDAQILYFHDLFGRKWAGSPSYPRGVSPHIWANGDSIGWYVYHPTAEDYAVLSKAVGEYLELFQTQNRVADRQWQQTINI